MLSEFSDSKLYSFFPLNGYSLLDTVLALIEIKIQLRGGHKFILLSNPEECYKALSTTC